ncbi:AMP-binding protein [Haloferacaceae archaeon DSL9]
MDVLGELFERDRRSREPALTRAETGRTMSYHDVITTAYRAGNVLRYLGVGSGGRIALADDAHPAPLLAFFGAAQLGAVATFDPPADDDRVVLVPVEREASIDDRPGRRLVVYGGPPTRATTAHWERDVWSENPAFPPVEVAADDVALVAGDRAYTHERLLEAAAAVVDACGLRADGAVAVRASWTDPRTVVAGAIAPLVTGAEIALPAAADDPTKADLAVVPSGVEPPEPKSLSLSTVPL